MDDPDIEPGTTETETLRATVARQTAALMHLESELRRAREQAQRAGSERTRFIAAASHDLLQPLSAARLYAATLSEKAAGTAAAELAQGIDASLGTVEDIMTALLDLSRLDSEPVAPQPQPFPVIGLMRNAAIAFQPLAQSRNVTLRIVPSTAAVLSDRALVGRVVTNLVSNAVKYNIAGGRVLIGARRRGDRVRLDVIDTGVGIPPAQQDRIFDEFTRLAPSSRMVSGLGLGLSIVRRLVALLGLELEVDSAPGRGSRFSVVLPASTALPAADAHAAEAVAGQLDLAILCVDNEPAIVTALSGLLASWGCDVRGAVSLKAVADEKLLEGWTPDLILMDYHLDQVSGLDAIEWLHQVLGAHVPVALVTADHSDFVRSLARERGIPILRKPVRPAALRSLVSALAARADQGPG